MIYGYLWHKKKDSRIHFPKITTFITSKQVMEKAPEASPAAPACFHSRFSASFRGIWVVLFRERKMVVSWGAHGYGVVWYVNLCKYGGRKSLRNYKKIVRSIDQATDSGTLFSVSRKRVAELHKTDPCPPGCPPSRVRQPRSFHLLLPGGEDCIRSPSGGVNKKKPSC